MRQRRSDVLLTLAACLLTPVGVCALVTPVTHLLPSHARDASWPAHARFHLTWAAGKLFALGCSILALAWVPLRRGERWAWWAAFANVAFGGAAVIPASRFQHGPIASWENHDRSTKFIGIALASGLSGLILAGATLASGTGARSGAADGRHQEP
jgi:hypothetical protein